jgi:hypothetical protein
MEFGKVPEEELNKVDFSLPKEPGENKAIISGKPFAGSKVYLGCAKWGRLEWVGKIYPPKTREKDFLKHYVEHYNAIELNATHYKIYGEKGTRNWAEKARGKDFRFCPKMFRQSRTVRYQKMQQTQDKNVLGLFYWIINGKVFSNSILNYSQSLHN